MDCPQCHAVTRVVETRAAESGAALRRRRECSSCSRRFTTYERCETEVLHVRKRDGERERFERSKLRSALLAATHKRPVRTDEVELLVERVESAIRAAGGEMASRDVGERCLIGLRELDPGAYLQFLGVFDPAVSELSRPADPARSVRGRSEDAELPAQAASRRGTYE